MCSLKILKWCSVMMVGLLILVYHYLKTWRLLTLLNELNSALEPLVRFPNVRLGVHAMSV